jgi:hypothetical protein
MTTILLNQPATLDHTISLKQEGELQATYLGPVLDVGLSEEDPITSNKKKQKPAPSDASENKERVGVVLPYHQPDASSNQVATGVMQADIENLKTNLRSLYEYKLSQYQEESVTLQDQLASG